MKKLLARVLAVLLVFLIVLPHIALAEQVDSILAESEGTLDNDSEYDDSEDYDSENDDSEIPLWEEWGYDSLEEFLEDTMYTLEEYYELEADMRMFRAYATDWEEEYRNAQIAAFEELGGTYGSLNVMFNGDFIEFGSGGPEISSNILYVPTAPFFEALGGEVSYDSKERSLIAEFEDGSKMILRIGDDSVTIEEMGKEREEFIYDPPYIKNNISYVPLRAVAKSLGLSVYWDSAYTTAVVVDIQGLIEEINKSFTIANKLLNMPIASSIDKSNGYKTLIDIILNLTEINSLDGNTSSKAFADISYLSNGESFYFKGTVDLSGLMEMLVAQYSFYSSEEEIEEMRQEFEKYSKMSLEIIFNFDEDVMYVKIPHIDMIFTEIPNGAWISIDGIKEIPELLELDFIDNETSIGSILGVESIGEIVFLVNNFRQYYNQVYLHRALMTSAALYGNFAGDERFEVSGDDFLLKLTTEDMNRLFDEDAMEYEYIDYYYYIYRYISLFGLDLTISTDDGEITGVSGEFIIREKYGYFYEMQVSAVFEIESSGFALELEIHEKNEMIIGLEINLNKDESSEQIPLAPPSGATIIKIEDLIEGFASWRSEIAQLMGRLSR